MFNSYSGDPDSNTPPVGVVPNMLSTPSLDPDPGEPRFAHCVPDGADVQTSIEFSRVVLPSIGVRNGRGRLCQNILRPTSRPSF